jgi:hypothetical protein
MSELGTAWSPRPVHERLPSLGMPAGTEHAPLRGTNAVRAVLVFGASRRKAAPALEGRSGRANAFGPPRACARPSQAKPASFRLQEPGDPTHVDDRARDGPARGEDRGRAWRAHFPRSVRAERADVTRCSRPPAHVPSVEACLDLRFSLVFVEEKRLQLPAHRGPGLAARGFAARRQGDGCARRAELGRVLSTKRRGPERGWSGAKLR